jgi:hypothetical protein
MKYVTGIFLASLLLATCALAADGEVSRIIAVYGAADTLLTPDIAKIKVGISDKDKKLAVAKARSDESLQTVVAVAAKFGLPRGDVQIGRVRVDRDYVQEGPNQPQIFKGFSLDRVVTLRLRDLARFEELLDALLQGGPLEFSYEYESSAKDEAMNALRLRAIRAAREKAEALAREAGARLGRVLEISEFPPGRGAPERNYNAMRMVGIDEVVEPSPQSLHTSAIYYVTFALE